MQNILTDAGPLIALFLANDTHHERAKTFAQHNTARLLTTCAVVTEVCYFLNSDGKKAFLTFVKRGAVTIEAIGVDDLGRIIQLVGKYQKMDFADASLVLLAEKTDITDIATVDRTDFDIYRTKTGKPFRNLF